MAVANSFTVEEAARKIGKCLSRHVKAVDLLTRNLIRIGNGALSESDTDTIQRLVQEAHGGAQEGYDMASDYLKKVQSACEKLTEEKGRLQKELKANEQQLSALQDQLPTITKEKELQESYLRSARESLRIENQRLERERENEKSLEIGRNIGIGLAFIPIVGTIPGGLLAIGCEIARAEAEENCRRAAKEVQRSQEEVSKRSSELESCNSRIKETKEKIKQTETKIQVVEDQLKVHQKLLKEVFTADCQLKQGTFLVNELLGKVEVLKLRSAKFLNLDALIIVVNDIIAHVLRLSNLLGGRLLHLEATTVEMLTTFSTQLKAIDWSGPDLSEWY